VAVRGATSGWFRNRRDPAGGEFSPWGGSVGVGRTQAVLDRPDGDARPRAEVDLDTLTAELCTVASQTMEPRSVSLRLRPRATGAIPTGTHELAD
jgi:hypothetical protein